MTKGEQNQNNAYLIHVKTVVRTALVIASLLLYVSGYSQDDCVELKPSFKAGESLTYEVTYNWGAIWTEAGSVTFSVEEEQLDGKPVYYFKGEGGTYPKYDWFFKVRDKYEAWSNPSSLKPEKFIRQVAEGSLIIYNNYKFDQKQNDALVRWFTSKKNKTGADTITYPECSFDVLSAIYYCRNIDYSKYNVNDTIPLTLILDKQVETTYIRYLGVKTLTTRDGKEVECIVFKPLLIEGSIFSGGEEMEVWVSNDENKVPMYIESKIIVGTIRVHLMDYQGLKVPKTYK